MSVLDTDDFLLYMVNQMGICLETEDCLDFVAEKIEGLNDNRETNWKLKMLYILLVS
jgi:hypothetical protein